MVAAPDGMLLLNGTVDIAQVSTNPTPSHEYTRMYGLDVRTTNKSLFTNSIVRMAVSVRLNTELHVDPLSWNISRTLVEEYAATPLNTDGAEEDGSPPYATTPGIIMPLPSSRIRPTY